MMGGLQVPFPLSMTTADSKNLKLKGKQVGLFQFENRKEKKENLVCKI